MDPTSSRPSSYLPSAPNFEKPRTDPASASTVPSGPSTRFPSLQECTGMKWSAIPLTLAFGFWSASIGAAQDSKAQPAKPAETSAKQSENLPDAASLFEKHIAAIGGMDALKAEKNRIVIAQYIGPGSIGEGSLRVLRQPPNKMYQTLEIPGVITQEVWCNGEDAWTRDSNAGTKRIQGDDLIEYRRQADYYGDANYKTRYKEMKTTAAEKFGEVDAYAVRVVPTEGKERTIYFDSKSGFIIGIRVPGSGGPEFDSVTTISDYKKFGAVMQPTKFVTLTGQIKSTVTIKDIQTDLTVMPTVDPPQEIRSAK
jgi:hypothetical protein